MNFLYILLSFLLGFLTKYCDKKFSNKILAISLFAVSIMIYLSTSNDGFVIFFPIFFGVLIGGKLDELHFKIDGVVYGAFSIYKIFLDGFPSVIILIIMAAAIDEFGNDMADRGELKLLSNFFKKRLFLDLFCFALAVASVLTWTSAIMLFCFDIGYQLATKMRA